MQWSHFVPAYDQWFDDIYVKRWGEENDTEVHGRPHQPGRDPGSRGGRGRGAERATTSSCSSRRLRRTRTRSINHNDDRAGGDEEARQDEGRSRFKSTYNPKTKKYFAFSDNYVPDPVHYRTDLWGEAGFRPTSWDNVLKAAPKLRAMGRPIGIGMSNEIDSNMALMAMMMCFGSFIQNKEHRVVLNTKGTVEALKFGRELYRQGMSNEIFAWTAASNNQAFVAGRLSMALNAISIARTAEGLEPGAARAPSSSPRSRAGLTAASGSST